MRSVEDLVLVVRCLPHSVVRLLSLFHHCVDPSDQHAASMQVVVVVVVVTHSAAVFPN